MACCRDKMTVIFQKGRKRMIVKAPLSGNRKIVVVLNSQFTNAPNTTQIASGAGRNSAAGNNAAIDSTNTQQQQSVGAGGKAANRGMNGKQSGWREKRRKQKHGIKAVVILNDQVVKLGRRRANASATQVADGAGVDGAGGTNAAIKSFNTRQQHAVGGGSRSRAFNKGMNSRQTSKGKKRRT